jgi:hypothetical protein
MAALSVASARSARAEAQRLRADSQGLKVAVRANLRVATAKKARAESMAARVCSVAPATSPWSRLEWVREDEQLSRVLVPLLAREVAPPAP